MELPRRKDVRLKAYDYSSTGAYFVTICTQDRRCVLSDILVGGGVLDAPCVRLTGYGAVVEQTILEMDRTYEHISVDNYVIMPNHVHLLLSVTGEGTSRTPSPMEQPGSESKIVGSGVPQRPCRMTAGANTQLPRSDIWNYIDSNPVKWIDDRYYQSR